MSAGYPAMVTWQFDLASAFSQTEGGFGGDVSFSLDLIDSSRPFCYPTHKALSHTSARDIDVALSRMLPTLYLLARANHVPHQHCLPKEWPQSARAAFLAK